MSSAEILLVEDDPVASRLMCDALQGKGHQIRAVKTVGRARDYLLSHRPALLLLDYHLPDGTASTLIDTLAQQPGELLPFVIMTGAGDERLAVEMMRRGARDYLVKDAQLAEILPLVVERVLRELDGERQLVAANQALLQTRLEYERLVENSPDIIARFDREGRHLFISNTIERFAGRPARDFIGRTKEEMGMPAAFCQQWRGWFERVFTTGEEQSFTFQSDSPNGPVALESRLIPERNEGGEVVTVLSLVRDVSRLRRAEQEAAQRGRQLETLFEASYAGIIQVDKDGIVRFANRHMAEMFGMTVEELLGAGYAQLLHPEEQSVGVQRMQQLIRGEIDHVLLERHYRRKNGSSFWGLLSGRRLCAPNGEFESLVGIITDVSDRRRAEEELQNSQRNLLQAQDLGKIASFEWNLASGRIDWTPQGFVLLERAPGTFEQTFLQWLEFVHPDDRSSLQQAIEGALAGRESQVEYRLVMPDGRSKPVITIGYVKVGADGAPQAILGVTQDLSERKAYENRLREARDRAEAASRAKSEFLANMSHELRTPLNGVLGMLQLLETTSLDAEQQEYVRTAASSGWSLLSLLNDILDLSRVEAGRMELRTEPFDVRELIDYCILFFRQSAEEKRLNLIRSVAAEVPTVLNGDVVRLRQILFNLLGNAIKFTPQGEVRVAVELLEVPTAETVRLRLLVTDSGIGIAPEMLKRVCEPFTQVEGPYQRHYQGAGLGLAIVKRLAELMRGEVAIANRAGGGTEVAVILNLALAAQPLIAAERKASVAEPAAGVRVLVAEDNPASRVVVVGMLEKTTGCQVTVVGDGRELLEVLAQQPFDLVLLDVQMPEIDGLEALRRIREDRSGRFDPHIPVVGITACAMAGDREVFLAAGMNACLDKPLRWRELAETIARLTPESTIPVSPVLGLAVNHAKLH